jgi:hypothetical protein
MLKIMPLNYINPTKKEIMSKLMLIAILAGTFLGCNSNYEEFIVGTWIHEGEMNEKYIFHTNGAYSFYFNDGSVNEGMWKFKWSKLILTGNDGEEETWRIKSLTNEELNGEIFVDFNFKVPYTMVKIN